MTIPWNRNPRAPRHGLLGALACEFLLLVSFVLILPSGSPAVRAAQPADPPAAAAPPALPRQSGPQADFSAAPRVGAAPLIVQFTDHSSGGPMEAYLWSFGDGFTATTATPTHTYSLAGVYTVSLTVWSGGLSDTLTRPAYIRVGVMNPQVTFSGISAETTDIAFNPDRAELLGAASVTATGTADIYGQRVNAATGGTIGGPFGISTAPGGQFDVHLAYHRGAGLYLAVWRDERAGASQLYGQRISGAGSLIGGNFLIHSGIRRLEVAANPVTATFLVVWSESPTGTLRARQVSTAGALIGDVLTLATGVDPDAAPALAHHPSGAALAVWAGADGQVWARAVLSDGTTLPAFSLSGPGAAEPAVAYDAGQDRFLVVWTQGAPGDREVVGRPATLTEPQGEVFLVARMGAAAARPFAAYDAATDQTWVIWGSNRYEDWDVYGQRITAQGVAGGTPLLLIANPGDERGWNIAEAGEYGTYLTWFNASTIYGAGFRPLRADFTADVRQGLVPLTVTFSDRSAPLGLIAQRRWDFGDGETSAEVNPTHVYTRPGRYTVSLTVEGAGQRHTEVKTDYIIVGYPVPSLQVTPQHIALTLRRGESGAVTYRVENVGTGATGPLTLTAPPALGWVTIAPDHLADLPPGAAATVTLTLMPPGDLPPGTYRDLVRVTGEGVQKAAAFSARVVAITRTLAVSVSDAAGPVAGASVHLVRREESLLVTEGVTTTVHEEAQAQSGDDGVALLEGLEVGTYDYTVTASGRGAARGVVTVTAGSGPQVLVVSLERLPLVVPEPLYPELHVRPGESAALEAAVRNAGLGAARNVRVIPPAGLPWLAVGVTGPAEELTAGETLSVTFLAAPPATLPAPAVYRQYVEVQADNAPPTRFALTVRVAEQMTGTFQMQVNDPAGAPIEGARVTLVRKHPTLIVTEGITQTHYESFVRTTDAGGVALFQDIPAGEYDAYVDARGFESHREDPIVPPGGMAVQNVSLSRLPFQATYTVRETQIPDVYAITVSLTFEAAARPNGMFYDKKLVNRG